MKSLRGFLAILSSPLQIEHFFSVCSGFCLLGVVGLVISLVWQKRKMACLLTPYFSPNLRKERVVSLKSFINWSLTPLSWPIVPIDLVYSFNPYVILPSCLSCYFSSFSLFQTSLMRLQDSRHRRIIAAIPMPTRAYSNELILPLAP